MDFCRLSTARTRKRFRAAFSSISWNCRFSAAALRSSPAWPNSSFSAASASISTGEAGPALETLLAGNNALLRSASLAELQTSTAQIPARFGAYRGHEQVSARRIGQDLVLLKYLTRAFEPGQRYTEKQVNEILLRYNEDTALLRRDLVDYKFMEREGGGKSYWLVE